MDLFETNNILHWSTGSLYVKTENNNNIKSYFDKLQLLFFCKHVRCLRWWQKIISTHFCNLNTTYTTFSIGNVSYIQTLLLSRGRSVESRESIIYRNNTWWQLRCFVYSLCGLLCTVVTFCILCYVIMKYRKGK